MKKRIVFVNLHTNWMMLKVTDVILLKNSVALKHKYLLDYLLHNIDKYEVCTYLNSNCFSLYQRGSDKLQRILRPIGIKENEWIMHQNGIKKGQIVVIKNANELKKDDLIVLYNVKTASYIGMGDVKAFKALSMLHFHGREEEDELIKNANINCFFNEVNLKTNCELYRKYYHIDKPWIIHPFVFAERFQNRKPFNERKNMAFATGTITYKVHKEFLDTYGDSCDQPSRKQIKDNPEFFKDTVYCTSSDYLEDNAGKPIKDNDFVLIKLYKKIYNRLFTGKQKKYFSFDMVEAFNSYKMCIVGEEILGIPGIGFVEGMACGCAYIGIFGGKIHGLVSNAGISLHEGNFRNVTEEGWDSQMNINLKGNYFMVKAYIEYLESLDDKNGNVVVITSERSRRSDDIPYGLTKAASNSFIECFASKVISEGIRVNGVAPGVTASDMTGVDRNGNMYANWQPSNRFFLPEEVAEVVNFLLSDVSNCISGEIIACDQGRYISHW